MPLSSKKAIAYLFLIHTKKAIHAIKNPISTTNGIAIIHQDIVIIENNFKRTNKSPKAMIILSTFVPPEFVYKNSGDRD